MNITNNHIEYITQTVFKNHTVKYAINDFIKKFNGTDNMFLGGKVEVDYDSLYNAYVLDKALTAIRQESAFKSVSIAHDCTARYFKIEPTELVKIIKSIKGKLK